MDRLSDRDGVKNATGWWFSPLSQVGSTSCALQCTPYGQDTVSANGCRSQSFTSWSCLSRVYYAGAVIDVDGPAGVVGKTHTDAALSAYPVREPTIDELALLTPMERCQLEERVKIFVSGNGPMTKTQYSVFLKREASSMERRNRHRRKVFILGPWSVGLVAQPPLLRGPLFLLPPSPLPRYVPVDRGFIYGDVIPVRCCTVTSYQTKFELEVDVPYSPLYQSLSQRLADPASSGVLSAVVRGPNIRDSMSQVSVVKATMQRPSSVFELAALVRAPCMTISVDGKSYSMDPILQRFLREPVSVGFIGTTIQKKPGFNKDSFRVSCVPVDVFVSICNNSGGRGLMDTHSALANASAYDSQQFTEAKGVPCGGTHIVHYQNREEKRS